MVDPDSGKPVASNEIRKGYEIESNRFVLLDDEDLRTAEPEPSDAIEIAAFLPAGHIASNYYDRPYYLGPDGDAKAYFALAEALSHKGKEGFARWVMRKKYYAGTLQSFENYLVLITLLPEEGVVAARELPRPSAKGIDAREVRMAEQLVAALEDDFRVQDYTDEYRDRVMQYIEAKARGHKPKLAVMPAPRKPSTSLADTLAASLKEAKKERAVA
jgi:DNA end-binding protein Ku